MFQDGIVVLVKGADMLSPIAISRFMTRRFLNSLGFSTGMIMAADGDAEADTETLALGEETGEAATEGEADAEGDTETDGETDTEGDILGFADALGEIDGLTDLP